MSADQAVLRTTLLPGLVEAAQAQLDAGDERIALFEIARVYLPSGEQLPEERWRVGGIVARRLPAGQGRRRGAARRAASRAAVRARRRAGRCSPPGQGGARRPASSASCIRRCSTGSWGVFELDLDDAGRRRRRSGSSTRT